MKSPQFLLAVLCFFSFLSTTTQAQDIINKKDGKSIICDVVDVNKTFILYKEYNNPDSPVNSIQKDEALSINYGNGKLTILEEGKSGNFSSDLSRTISLGFHRLIITANGESGGANGLIGSFESRPVDKVGWRIPFYLLISEGTFASVGTGINPKLYLNESDYARVFIGPEVNVGYIPDFSLGEALFLGDIGFSFNPASRINMTFYSGFGYYMIFGEGGSAGVFGMRIAVTAGINF